MENIHPNVKNLCTNTDIFDIAKLSENSIISVGNDTGPMHVIANGNMPTFVFFTKYSDPKLCAPVGKNVKIFNYENNIPPFFTNDALKYISDMDIEHLIVDIPSIDRMNDHGLLGNHRIFWNNGQNINEKVNQNSKKTITEMSYIPNNIKDGFFFLNLQIPHFVCDAAPSRPLLIKAT